MRKIVMASLAGLFLVLGSVGLAQAGSSSPYATEMRYVETQVIDTLNTKHDVAPQLSACGDYVTPKC